MSRHTIGELRQKQALPLDEKVIMTKQRIKAWYEHWDGDVYVSFSGGKDSTVLKHIVDSMYDDVPSVFCNTGLEYPELRKFALAQKNTVRVDPDMYFYEVIEKFGYPVIGKKQARMIRDCQNRSPENEATVNLYLTGIKRNGEKTKSFKLADKWKPLIDAPFKVSEKCCDIMKKRPLKKYEKETGRKPIIGTMAFESHMRESAWLMNGCNAFNKKFPSSQPMSFWTEQDVLQYILRKGIDIAPVYGQVVMLDDGHLTTTGEKRTGCMFCAFGVHLEELPNRFMRMQKTHPKQWNYCINKLGMGEVLDFINVPYENKKMDMFEGVA